MTANTFDTALIIAGNWNSNNLNQNWLKLFSPDPKTYEKNLLKPISELNIPKNLSPSPNFVSPATQKIRSQSNSSTFKTLSISSTNSSECLDSNSPKRLFGSNSFQPTRQNWLYKSSKPSTSPKTFQNDKKEMVFNGKKSLEANTTDRLNWKDQIPIAKYPINEDLSPEIIVKKSDKTFEYDQEIGIRYLRPPTPPDHGDIIIRHEKSIIPPIAPPLIIRQEPQKPKTPPPLVIRESPPKPIQKLKTKIITIPAKNIPPPPRKVIIERLPQIPAKPQSIIVERWLPYKSPKRRVIYQKPEEIKFEKPKNLIIEWENPGVIINRKFKNLGIIKADPDDYLRKYESEVKEKKDLPDFVRSLEPPEELEVSNESVNDQSLELIGDFEALSLVEPNNLGENDREIIKDIVEKYMKNYQKSNSININAIVAEIIDMVKAESAKMIRFDEAMKIIKSINQKLKLISNDEEIESYLSSINLNRNNHMELDLFKSLVLLKFY